MQRWTKSLSRWPVARRRCTTGSTTGPEKSTSSTGGTVKLDAEGRALGMIADEPIHDFSPATFVLH
jgi:hypothetical protein